MKEDTQNTENVVTSVASAETEAAPLATEAPSATEEQIASIQKVEQQTETGQGATCPLLNNWKIPLLVLILLIVVAKMIIRASAAKKSDKGRRGQKAGASGRNADSVEIYVGNLSYDMSEDQFRREFERFGVVKSARIIGHRNSGKSKGYGFVEMPHRKEATVAIKALHNREVMGRKLRVNEARKGSSKR